MSKALKYFVTGVGQSIDMGGTLTPRHVQSSRLTQGYALRRDWQRVGSYMESAMRKSGRTTQPIKRAGKSFAR